MAKAKKLKEVKFKSKIISLRELCVMAKVNYFTVYRRRFGIYQSPITLVDRTKLANAVMRDIGPFMSDLGFDIAIKPLADPSQQEKVEPQR